MFAASFMESGVLPLAADMILIHGRCTPMTRQDEAVVPVLVMRTLCAGGFDRPATPENTTSCGETTKVGPAEEAVIDKTAAPVRNNT